MKVFGKEREPLPLPALAASFGAVACMGLACASFSAEADSSDAARMMTILVMLGSVVGLLGASAFTFSASAVIAGLCVVVFAADDLLAVVIVASLLLAALQLFDTSRVLRRAPELDRTFLTGRLFANGGLALCGALMAVTVTVVAESRTWAAALIPTGIATVSIGLLATWFLIRRQNKAAMAERVDRAKQNYQPPPPSPVARPLSYGAAPRISTSPPRTPGA